MNSIFKFKDDIFKFLVIIIDFREFDKVINKNYLI